MKLKTVTITGNVRGRPITIYNSKPSGYSHEEYMDMDAKAVTAFGSLGTRTEGVQL